MATLVTTLRAQASKIDRTSIEPAAVAHVDEILLRLSEIEVAEAYGTDPIITKLVESYRTRVKAIEQTLLSKKSKDLPDRERDNMLDVKALYENLISTFNPSSAEPLLAKLADDINYYLT